MTEKKDTQKQTQQQQAIRSKLDRINSSFEKDLLAGKFVPQRPEPETKK
jgi:hypothetical protein